MKFLIGSEQSVVRESTSDILSIARNVIRQKGTWILFLELKRSKKLHAHEPSDWFEKITADVFCYNQDFDGKLLAGRISGTLLNTIEASVSGESIYDIFDSDSSEFESLFTFLFDSKSELTDPELREEHGNVTFDQIVYLQRSVFHPALKEWRPFVVDSFCNMFEHDALIAIWDTTSFCTADLSDDEVHSLGFNKPEGLEIFVRSNSLMNEYSAANDPREASEVTVPDTAAEYVEREWGQ